MAASTLFSSRTPEHHLWVSPGVPANAGVKELHIRFDVAQLDIIGQLPQEIAEQIVDYELPHICDLRPHEDPNVEMWLQRWVDDSDGKAGESFGLTLKTLVGLTGLVDEREEMCPLLRIQVGRFERALADWLKTWPHDEPWREGLPRSISAHAGHSPQDLELELHAALNSVRFHLPENSHELTKEVADTFEEVAHAWVLKLDSVYGLDIVEQPERIVAAHQEAEHLSILHWGDETMCSLLRCPYFRPAEQSLLRLVRRWTSSNPEGCRDGVLTTGIIWELLPAEERPPENEYAADDIKIGGSTPSAEGSEEALSKETHHDAVIVAGSSFEHVRRHHACTTVSFDEPGALGMRLRVGSASLHAWNAAHESQILGASRQMLASRVPMSTDGGRYRLDFRIISGTELDGAHLFEVGLALNPWAGVRFKVSGPGFEHDGVDAGDASPYFAFVAVLDEVVEGIRVSVEVDFGNQIATVRSLPSQTNPQKELEWDDRMTPMPLGAEASFSEQIALQRSLPRQRHTEKRLDLVSNLTPTPLAAWLHLSAVAAAVKARPKNEQSDPLFKEHAIHLHQRIEEGTLDGKLASAVLNDHGVQSLRGIGVPTQLDGFHFYLVLPAGMEVEIF